MTSLFRNFNVDLDLLKISNVSVNELMSIIKIYSITVHKQYFDYNHRQEDLDSLSEKKFIRHVKNSTYVLRSLGKTLVSKTIGIAEGEMVKKKVDIPTDIESLVDAIRDKFRGIKTGAMGDRKSLSEKLTRWRMNNSEVTESDILDAVDLYLSSESNARYVQRADYFVYKKLGGTESSRLSIFVDELKESRESDWTSNII